MAMSPAIISVPANSSVFRVGSLAREVPFRLSMKHSIQYLERAISYLLINYLLTQLLHVRPNSNCNKRKLSHHPHAFSRMR